MFGDLSLVLDEQQISCKNNRSRQTWLLLACLIGNRHTVVSSDELVSLLGNENKSGNPAGAMKTALHRVRSLLDTLSPDAGHRMILYRNGGYIWNPELPVRIDTEEFEHLLAAAAGTDEDPEKKLEYLTEALTLYGGDFLSMYSSEPWVIPISAYYHNRYLQALQTAVPLLEHAGRHAEAAAFCRKALATDPYSETLYQLLMRCLLALGQRQEVVAVYEDMSKLLLSDFGVMPDQESRALYREALRTVNHNTVSPEILLEQLNESGPVSGALLCDYDFFKMLYQAKARMIARSGDAVHIALLTVRGRMGKEPARRSLELAMDNLETHICHSLRKGDVVTRCSASQFVVMLPQANYENSGMVCRRVIDSFEQQYPHSPIRIDVFVHPIVPPDGR